MIIKNIIFIAVIAFFMLNRLSQVQSFIGFASESPNPILRQKSRKQIYINMAICLIILLSMILTIVEISILFEILIAVIASIIIEILTFGVVVIIDYLK